jgi:hypothetical protein
MGNVLFKDFALILAQIAVSQNFALEERQISFFFTESILSSKYYHYP